MDGQMSSQSTVLNFDEAQPPERAIEEHANNPVQVKLLLNVIAKKIMRGICEYIRSTLR